MHNILFTYILVFFLTCNVYTANAETCLLGQMTDLQDWVNQDGSFKTDLRGKRKSLDLSRKTNIRRKIWDYFSGNRTIIDYLSLAQTRLDRIPDIFEESVVSAGGSNMSELIRHVSFYGNNFGDDDDEGNKPKDSKSKKGDWYDVFKSTQYPALLELDLRNCKIKKMDAGMFRNMPKLEALYLGDNHLAKLAPQTFIGLSTLRHLDISNNVVVTNPILQQGLIIETNTFRPLKNLVSLDLSHSKVVSNASDVFANISTSLTRLSLCNTYIKSISGNFPGKNLKILDISGNGGMLNDATAFKRLRHLKAVRANNIGLYSIDVFADMEDLEILIAHDNMITDVVVKKFGSLVNLRILDLEKNRVMSWLELKFTYLKHLQYLSLRGNTINLIHDIMLDDMKNISYLALAINPFVCTCTIREFLRRAEKTERKKGKCDFEMYLMQKGSDPFLEYHTTNSVYGEIIKNRNPTHLEYNVTSEHVEVDTYLGSFLLVDYETEEYQCTDYFKEKRRNFEEVERCKNQRSNGLQYIIDAFPYYLYTTAAIVSLVLVIAAVIAWKWWYIRYFFILVKNAATLSLISNEEQCNEDNIAYSYDVFVSYCNGDREWVLTHLLPKIEMDDRIRVCLHERDFQIGLTILENIVSCMDRSRNIMLIISQEFLLSQWCQFEMHLAQHRLVETRRENLLLILLEDIPRRRRPNTLHYLMMTKTYLEWKKGTSHDVFWKRVKTAIQRQPTQSYV